MNHFARAEQYLESAERVREKMIELEKLEGAIDPAQLDHATQAIRNFGILAQAHSNLAMVQEMRKRSV